MPPTCEICPHVCQWHNMQLMLHASATMLSFTMSPQEAGVGSIYSGTGFQVPGKLQARTLLPLSDDASPGTEFLLIGT